VDGVVQGPHQTPSVDGRTTEMVERTTKWAVLDSLFLKELHAGLFQLKNDGDSAVFVILLTAAH
jgi:hypothetical protein